MPPPHRFPRWALIVPAALVLAALAWVVFAVPALVRYPTDLEVSPRYEGTFTLFVDPTSAAPLDEPVEVPLVVERHIEVDGDESSRDLAVVEETIRQEAGDLFETTQTNVYVMDRRSLENVADDRAYAFEPSNVVDRSPAYRLNLPFDLGEDDTNPIYKNEIAATYDMRPDPDGATEEVGGLTLHPFVAELDEAPIDAAYLEELGQVVPLPRELTFEQLEPHLAAAGIDVTELLAELGPVLAPEDLDTLVALTEETIPLDYVMSFEGRAGIELTTGAEVDVGASESVGARPRLAAEDELRAVLGRYPEVPAAAEAATALDEVLDGPPVRLFEYSYDQTAASVEDVADTVADLRQQVDLATTWVPAGLAALAVVVLGAGLVVHGRRRSHA
ncbi:porin PorA family protein [Actinomarinicola tropica]|uniref:DUF3068 domain-containing protein n=1 Tax=Actinomarinicola tropica TaxID=2789776 RepID=A0A5Q2RJ24_9ACTN|nr:porin PorA family protein [Actinomarinicola tropica]QGG94571.1 DUF3068 domain-containing protein [Actinomarinicola tropica]